VVDPCLQKKPFSSAGNMWHWDENNYSSNRNDLISSVGRTNLQVHIAAISIPSWHDHNIHDTLWTTMVKWASQYCMLTWVLPVYVANQIGKPQLFWKMIKRLIQAIVCCYIGHPAIKCNPSLVDLSIYMHWCLCTPLLKLEACKWDFTSFSRFFGFYLQEES
jgi:hypothetical protein